jgi:hypothetical protein
MQGTSAHDNESPEKEKPIFSGKMSAKKSENVLIEDHTPEYPSLSPQDESNAADVTR